MKTITLIDDNHLDLSLLKSWFETSKEYKVVHLFYSGIDALQQIELVKTDICIIDTRMPLLSGIETATLMLHKGYKGKIIGVSHAYYHEDMQKSMAAGTHGYCRKEKDSVYTTLTKVDSEGHCFDMHYYEDWKYFSEHRDLITKDEDGRTRLLNPHFKKILLYSCIGLTTDQMGELMGLKKHTVEQYRANMLQQLEFSNIAQATAWAIANQIISLSQAYASTVGMHIK